VIYIVIASKIGEKFPHGVENSPHKQTPDGEGNRVKIVPNGVIFLRRKFPNGG
jgi:hypothetical protein